LEILWGNCNAHYPDSGLILRKSVGPSRILV
jgi:hypothetical protein